MVRLYLDRIDAHEADIARLDARIEEAIAPLSVLGTPVKVDPLGISAVGPRSRSVLGAVDPVVGVKVERPERSEDERP